jgi:O-antigen/teichoic acid export membrane protein
MSGGASSLVARLRDAARSLGAGRGWVLFAALVSVNLGNLVFHSLASHMLGPASYGAVASILSILLAVSIPVSATQVALTGEVARRTEAGEEAPIAPLVRRFVLAGCAGAVACLAISPLLAAYLHLDSVMPLVWLALYLVPLSAGIVPWASLCGRRRFSAVAAGVSAGTAVRLGVGAAVLGAGGGISGAVAATFVGEVVIAGTLLTLASPLRRAGHEPLTMRWDEALRGAIAVGGLWILVALDTVLARHYLSPVEAGTYAAASMAARGALYLPQAVAAVALPSLATTDSRAADGALRRALLAAAAIGVVAVVGLTAGSQTLLPIVFGPGFDASPLLVALLALAATGAGLLSVLVQYSIVQRSQAAAAAWVGVITLPLLALIWHGDARAVAAAALLAIGLALLAALAGVHRRRRARLRPALRGGLAAVSELDLTVVVPYHRPGGPLHTTLLNLVEALERSDVRLR